MTRRSSILPARARGLGRFYLSHQLDEQLAAVGAPTIVHCAYDVSSGARRIPADRDAGRARADVAFVDEPVQPPHFAVGVRQGYTKCS